MEARNILGINALVSIVAVGFSAASLHAQTTAPGGFMDSATSAGLRSQFSAAEIQTFLPDRGIFRFPSPYLSQGARITNASDCGGTDCVHAVGYSYWSNINNHVGSDTMLIFLGLERRQGGGGPTLFSYKKTTGEVRNEGPLFSADSPYSWATGEGWYFSAKQPTTLYVNVPTTSTLQRYDVVSHALTTVFDVASRPDLFGTNRYIWQFHSSADDRVHSATLKDASSYADLGCLVYREDTNQFSYYPQKGFRYDECQIDKSGRWLVIKEKLGTDPTSEVDDRIIDLQTGTEKDLLDRNGAGGHSDTGFGYMVASDNYNPMPGAVRLWDFNLDLQGGEPLASVPGQGTLIFQTTSWDTDVGHIAFGNAQAGVPIDQQYVCSANASREALSRANEILCYRLDGSLDVLVVAPNLTSLDASGGGSDDYSKLPKGNLDITGEYYIWTGNAGTNRLDAYIVRIPKDRLSSKGAFPPPAPLPAPAPTPVPGSAQPVRWTSLVNVTANGNSLQKTGGCDGCEDARAVSAQQITAGDGFVEFTASETNTLRHIGLSTVNIESAAAAIRFSFRLQAGTAEVREEGVYKGELGFATGDTLRVALVQGAVNYWKNGAVFYTSATPAVYPLLVDTALNDLGATINDVVIATSSSPSSPSTEILRGIRPQ